MHARSHILFVIKKPNLCKKRKKEYIHTKTCTRKRTHNLSHKCTMKRVFEDSRSDEQEATGRRSGVSGQKSQFRKLVAIDDDLRKHACLYRYFEKRTKNRLTRANSTQYALDSKQAYEVFKKDSEARNVMGHVIGNGSNGVVLIYRDSAQGGSDFSNVLKGMVVYVDRDPAFNIPVNIALFSRFFDDLRR